MSSETLATCKPQIGGVPDGWRNVVLSDCLADFRNGWTYDTRALDGTMPITRIETISNGVIDYGRIGFAQPDSRIEAFRLERNDILFSHINSVEHIAKVAIKVDDRPLYHGMNLMRLRPNDQVFPRFLFARLQSEQTRGHFRSACKRAVNQASLNKGEIGSYQFPLPPLDEQRRIAEVLRSMDEAIAAADGVARQWATTFETLLEVAFAEGERSNLGNICSLIYRYPGFYGFDQLEAGVPVIRGEHLRAGRISRDWADFYFVDPSFSARFPKTILELDDVVMSVRGTVGTTAVVDAAHVGSQISPNLIRLVADPAKIVPPLLYYAVQSAVAHMRRTIVNAQALPAINAGDLKQVEIALPPLADQPALLAELNGAAAARSDAVSAAQQARQTKAVVMTDLLSGRVRVPA